MPDFTRIWFDAFSDPEGGFYERLDSNKKPLNLPKRLLTQCRQIYVHASSGRDMSEKFAWMLKNYRDSEGGWRFSDADDKRDLYAHAFVILACAATDQKDVARMTLNYIKKNLWRTDAQNPLMHLLEACLIMAGITHEPVYGETADKILELFFTQFFDGKTLCEFAQGDKRIEAGHQSEWVWLLSECQRVLGKSDPRIAQAKTALFSWVKTHGIDQQYGGIFNAQKPDGTMIDDQKRIWPVCETIRAARIMGDAALHDSLTQVLNDRYLTPDGFWTEILNRDLTPATDYLPGTTPYHIYPVIPE